MLTSEIIENLRSAYEANDFMKVAKILSTEINFPQLAMIEGAVISISKPAKYVVCTKELLPLDPKSDAFSHYNIKRRYTHFSSPIRRYFDIVVQRIIKALIEKKDLPYTRSELATLCRILNIKTKNSKRYSKSIDRAQMASQWEDEGMQNTIAYVCSPLQKKHKHHLFFPSGRFNEFMMRDDTTFDLSQLNYYKREGNDITWQVLAVAMSSPDYLIKCPSFTWNASSQQRSGEVTVNFFSRSSGDESREREHKVHSLAIKSNNSVVQLEAWKTTAHECIKHPTRENVDAFMNNLELPTTPSPDDRVMDEENIVADITQSPLLKYTVKSKFCEGYPVNVWVSKSLKKSISSPGLNLIEVAPTVRICLQHIQNPVVCFSDTQLELSIRTQYRSEEEYVNLWSKALLAEASHDGVSTKKLFFLKGACLQWPKLVRCGTSIDKANFKHEENLSLQVDLEKFDMMDLLGIRSGDLVCARYEIPEGEGKFACEVYHFHISGVKNEEKKEEKASKELTLLLDSFGCRVSEKMEKLLKSNPPRTCDMQIMKISNSFKLVDYFYYTKNNCMTNNYINCVVVCLKDFSVLRIKDLRGTMSGCNLL